MPPTGIHRASIGRSSTLLISLGPTLPGNERPRRRSVLYRDDHQVKFLYADLDQGWSREGSVAPSAGQIYLVARRARDVAADLSMAVRLHRDCSNDEDDEEESPFWSSAIPEEPELGWPLDPGSARTHTERYLADAFRFHHVMGLQEAILASTDSTLIWALGSYLDDLSNDRDDRSADLAAIVEESRAASRDLLLSHLLTLPMPACHKRRENRWTSFG
jgi:hypothetical protein